MDIAEVTFLFFHIFTLIPYLCRSKKRKPQMAGHEFILKL